jgi:hypothetical protein
MKLAKRFLLMTLLSLSLMVNNCGGANASVECATLSSRTACFSELQCWWVKAKCVGTPTAAPNKCPSVNNGHIDASYDDTQQTRCQAVAGCTYSSSKLWFLDLWYGAKCTGTPTTAPAECPRVGLSYHNLESCNLVPGCTYFYLEKAECVDAEPILLEEKEDKEEKEEVKVETEVDSYLKSFCKNIEVLHSAYSQDTKIIAAYYSCWSLFGFMLSEKERLDRLGMGVDKLFP